MIYLYLYLAIGVAVFAVVFTVIFAEHRQTKKDEPESLRGPLDAVDPDRKKLSYRLLNIVVRSVLATVAFVVAWPAVICLKVMDIIGKKGVSALDEEREFAVERSHLQERLSLLQIEARELVTDPLGAVQDLPFGHLNAAWKTFVEGVGADDELWSFTAPWQTKWGRKEIRTGYVIVRGRVPASHFLTMRKKIEDVG